MTRFLARPRARTVGILALLFGLYGVLFYLHQRGEKQDHRLIDFSIDRLTGLKVLFGDTVTLELKRKGYPFVFVQPYAGLPADPRALKNYLSVLERVPVRRRWTDKEDQTKYGIGPASPRLVLITPKKEYAYALGNKNPVAQEFFVSRLDTDEIALLPAPSAALFQVRGLDFRNRRIFSADGVVTGWELWIPGRPLLKGEKRGEEWMSAEGESPLTPCDRRQAKALEDRISALRLSDFDAVDQHLSVAAAGLSSPVARLTVRFATGPAVELTFGSIPGKDPYTVAVNGDIRGGVPKPFLAGWPQQSADLQKKTLMDFPLSAIVRFTATQDETTALYEKQRGKWFRLGREQRPVDLRTIQLFLLTLAKIQIDTFDFNGKVDPVTRQYAFFDGDGNTLLDLRLGAESAGQVPATFGGASYRFMVPAMDVGQLGL